MARTFNGSSDAASVALNLSAYSLLTLSFWLWQDAYSTATTTLSTELTANSNTNNGAFFLAPNSSAGFLIAFREGASGQWSDSFTQPSSAAWHHFVIQMDRAGTLNKAWVDSVAQSLSTQTHNVITYNNFANSTLYLMSRATASLFDAGRLAEFAIWGGVSLTAVQIKALSIGRSPFDVCPAPTFYAPLWGGDSPEPEYSGSRKSVTLAGTSASAHPWVQPGLFTPRQSHGGTITASVAAPAFKFGGASIALDMLDQIDRLNH